MVLLACATTARRVPVRLAARDDKGVSFLPFASSRVERFSDQEGRPCPAVGGRVRNNVLGWEPTLWPASMTVSSGFPSSFERC